MSARILFVAPRFHTNLFGATKALVRAGHVVEVFVPKTEPTEDYSFVTPRVFPTGTPSRDIRRAVHAFAPDLIIIRKARPVHFAVYSAARFGRYPLWHYDQRACDRPQGWMKTWEFRLQGLPARRVTPKSGLSGAPCEPLATFLPWPVAAEPVARVPRDGPLRVICVGKLMQPRKNQDKLIAAMAPFLKDGRAVLTLVGSTLNTASGADKDHQDALLDAVALSGGTITLKADLPFAQMPALYAAHDVCVLPAHRETLGIAPVEAMAYGLVPVVTRQCGCACYITPGEDGFITRAGDVAGLAEVIHLLVDQPDTVVRMGQAAQRKAETELGPERFLERMEALLERGRRGHRA